MLCGTSLAPRSSTFVVPCRGADSAYAHAARATPLRMMTPCRPAICWHLTGLQRKATTQLLQRGGCRASEMVSAHVPYAMPLPPIVRTSPRARMSSAMFVCERRRRTTRQGPCVHGAPQLSPPASVWCQTSLQHREPRRCARRRLAAYTFGSQGRHCRLLKTKGETQQCEEPASVLSTLLRQQPLAVAPP